VLPGKENSGKMENQPDINMPTLGKTMSLQLNMKKRNTADQLLLSNSAGLLKPTSIRERRLISP
jgi:hypothetical protein